MLKLSNVKLEPNQLENEMENLKVSISDFLCVNKEEVLEIKILRKSIDARKKPIVFAIYTLAVLVKNEEKFGTLQKIEIDNSDYEFKVEKIKSNVRPVIVGCGPAGMFAGLILASAGLKPIILERGKCVEERKNDILKLQTSGELNENSNILFGAGGAGTFSDGKLNTGLNNPDIKKVLRTFVKCGAPENVEYDAKPHIGSDILFTVVKNLTNKIETLGGEIRYSTKLENITLKSGKVESIEVCCESERKTIPVQKLILAIGHSARDTYRMLFEKGIKLEQKPFSMGVRIEHPRELINESQYGKNYSKFLPTADYKLSTHLKNGRGVYTFCMCPGGVVVPAMSQAGTLNVNGMSYHSRNEENSNSAVLVSVNPEDCGNTALSGVEFQEFWERKAFNLAGGKAIAPCETFGDFAKLNKKSSLKISSSYLPNVKKCDLSLCLPQFVSESLKAGILEFDKKLKGFADPNAVLVGIETRSSSPVRIERNEKRESVSGSGIYPIGEGAGYSGGIVSSALDGVKTAMEIINLLKE